MAIIHLIENFVKDWKIKKKDVYLMEKLPLNESNRILEYNGKQYNSLGAYIVPIWKLDEKNLNNRVYPKKLGEKVVKENQVTLALKDHPKDEDGSVNNIAAIGKNPFIRNSILYCECYMVDEEFDKKIKNIIEKGGGIGLSSSAYGEVDSNGYVLEEDFTVERFFDFVLSPSYCVYLTKESEIKNQNQTEQLCNKNLTINNNIKENLGNNMNKENNETKKSLLPIEERNLRLHLERRFKEIEQLKEIEEKIQAYNECLSFIGEDEVPDLKQVILSELADLNKKIEELAKKGKVVDSLEEENKKFKEKVEKLYNISEGLLKRYECATELLDSQKQFTNKLKEMYQFEKARSNGMIDAETYSNTVKYLEDIEKQNELLQLEIDSLNKAVKRLNEEKRNLIKQDFDENRENRRLQLSKQYKLNKRQENRQEELKNMNIELQKQKELEEKKQMEENFNFKNNKEIIEYYNDLLEQNPKVSKIKEDILKCKTLFEAQTTFLRLKSLVEDTYYDSEVSYYEKIKQNDNLNEDTKNEYSDRKLTKAYKDWI